MRIYDISVRERIVGCRSHTMLVGATDESLLHQTMEAIVRHETRPFVTGVNPDKLTWIRKDPLYQSFYYHVHGKRHLRKIVEIFATDVTDGREI